MSLGEIIYSFTNRKLLPTNKECNMNFMRETSDEQLYTSIEKALKYERED